MEWTAELQAETTLSVLRGEAALPYLNMVLLNSAVRLWVAEKAGSIEEGIYMARHAIEQGAAFRSIRNGPKRLNLYQPHKYIANKRTSGCPSIRDSFFHVLFSNKLLCKHFTARTAIYDANTNMCIIFT